MGGPRDGGSGGHTGHGACHTDNSVRIDADPDLVWDLTNDVERWPELFTEYASATILHRDGDTIRLRLTMHPDADGNAWSWVSERTADRAARRVTARRVEPGWFEYMHIEWTYRPEGPGTRMRWVQDFAMRADSPVAGAAMTARINANTRIQMDAIKRKVELAATAAYTAATDTAAAETTADTADTAAADATADTALPPVALPPPRPPGPEPHQRRSP